MSGDADNNTSAGLLMYRFRNAEMEVLLAHPGGPFWRNKDAGAWTIPKGRIKRGEDFLAAAQREFEEETGIKPQPPFLELPPVRQKSGKLVYAWAFAGDCDPQAIRSNTFEMEWPPKSGRLIQVPEIDRAEFFAVSAARSRINPAQMQLLLNLAATVGVRK